MKLKELTREERNILFHTIAEGDVDTSIVMGFVQGKTKIFIGDQSVEFTVAWLRQVADALENSEWQHVTLKDDLDKFGETEE